jgi:ureidoglycolate dehydrogenase (NAD+)
MLETPDIPRDQQQESVVPAGALRELMVSMYVRKGMYRAEAEIVADRQIEADLRGIHSHGSRATPWYLKGLDAGDIDPRGMLTIVKQTPAIAILDGSRNLGHVASTKAMLLAIEMARTVGTGTVAVRNSQHFGAASVYSLMAAREGMVGFCTTSTGTATVAAYGSRHPGTANNAQAWAAPVRTGAPFCLDFACAVASWGKVQTRGRYGLPIPDNWAFDSDGNPTTDAKAAKTLLPAAGARGSGLAFLSSIVAGTLVGGKMPLHKKRSAEAEGSEHFFYAIDVAQFTDYEEYLNEMDQTVADIHALTPADGFKRVTIPGELEWEREREWSKTGIPLHHSHLQELQEAAAAMKLTVPWKPV